MGYQWKSLIFSLSYISVFLNLILKIANNYVNLTHLLDLSIESSVKMPNRTSLRLIGALRIQSFTLILKMNYSSVRTLLPTTNPLPGSAES